MNTLVEKKIVKQLPDMHDRYKCIGLLFVSVYEHVHLYTIGHYSKRTHLTCKKLTDLITILSDNTCTENYVQ